MKVSLLGPTNLEKFSQITGRSLSSIRQDAATIGSALAQAGVELRVVFNYAGMLRFVGDAFKVGGGRLSMLFTANDEEWETKCYEAFLQQANVLEEKRSWHEVLASLVSDADVVVCAGLSAGVFVELGYMKWNLQDGRGRVKRLILIKELVRDERLPPELAAELDSITTIVSLEDLAKTLQSLSC